MSDTKPLVSVVTITYNHEKWIGKCIEGVLMQKTDFPLEMIVAEDCGPDGTRAICEDYAAKHPDIIRLLPSEKNLGPKENEKRAMAEVRGKYIAFCEGDDYWTEPAKLQRQVDFLEANPDYTVCFARWRNYNDVSGKFEPDKCDDLFPQGTEGIDLDIDMFFQRWVTQPMTMVYRADAISLELYDRYKYYRDHHQIYHLLKAGKGYVMNLVTGVRVKHEGGMASMISDREYCERALPLTKEFYLQTRDKWPKKGYMDTLQICVGEFAADDKMKALGCAIKLFTMNFKIKRFLRNIRKVIIS